MEIWIKKDAKNVIRLPINPEGFEISWEANNNEITRYGKGPAILMGKSGLKKISFSAFFPKQAYQFNQYQNSYKLSNGTIVSLKAPIDYIKIIESWRDIPVTLIITGANINGVYTIESFAYNEPDPAGDISYTLSLKKYEKPTYSKPASEKTSSTATSGKSSSKGNKSERSTKSVTTKKYIVKKNDTLQKISKRLTGTTANWKKIYTQNKKVIETAAKKHGKKASETGRWIYPGIKLVIKI